MKKISISLFIVLFAITAHAFGTFPMRISGGGAAGPCTTAADSCTGQDDGSYTIGDHASRKWTGSLFTAAADATLCKLVLVLSETGTYAGQVTACIYADDGALDKPGAEIDCATSTAGAADIPGAAGNVTFTGLSAAVVSGTKYHVVIWSSTTDAANHIRWYNEDDDCLAIGESSTRSPDGLAWLVRSPIIAMEFQAYK